MFEDSIGLSENDYTFESDFRKDLGLDSLDLVDFIMNVEKEFNLSIPDNIVADLNNLEDLNKYVNGHIK
jgi:acyl carrier protein